MKNHYCYYYYRQQKQQQCRFFFFWKNKNKNNNNNNNTLKAAPSQQQPLSSYYRRRHHHHQQQQGRQRCSCSSFYSSINRRTSTRIEATQQQQQQQQQLRWNAKFLTHHEPFFFQQTSAIITRSQQLQQLPVHSWLSSHSNHHHHHHHWQFSLPNNYMSSRTIASFSSSSSSSSQFPPVSATSTTTEVSNASSSSEATTAAAITTKMEAAAVHITISNDYNKNCTGSSPMVTKSAALGRTIDTTAITTTSHATTTTTTRQRQRRSPIIPNDGLTFHDFIMNATTALLDQQQQQLTVSATTTLSSRENTSTAVIEENNNNNNNDDDNNNCSTNATNPPIDIIHHHDHPTKNDVTDGVVYTFAIKTYGCQMNVNDTEIVRSVLLSTKQFQEVVSPAVGDTTNHNNNNNKDNADNSNDIEPDIFLTNTCAIRDGAEQKVITRLQQLRARNRDKKKKKNATQQQQQQQQSIIGVLGCMAERLKDQLLQDNMADLVVGPVAYRSLPQLLLSLLQQQRQQQNDQQDHTTTTSKTKKVKRQAINVELSNDETYADIIPMRQQIDHEHDDTTNSTNSSNSIATFVSIQRGCSNRCSFCIVPFTRGIERSRPYDSIIHEIQRLHYEQNIQEVTLLGQNVNSYHDQSSMMLSDGKRTITTTDGVTSHVKVSTYQLSNPGFKSRIQRSDGGYFFVDLLDAVSNINPSQLRVRFTSPHPKDFPKPLLQLMSERPNICNHIHMPAQSGSSSVLKRMKRGYTREAYIQLIADVKSIIPDVAISSDFIAGFCNETEEEHADTISLLQHVQYDQAYMFAYSRRDGTYAAKTMDDNVPEIVKQRRLREIIDTYQDIVQTKNTTHEIGRLRLVLVEGIATTSKKNRRDCLNVPLWSGRTDQNKRILFTAITDVDDSETLTSNNSNDNSMDSNGGISCYTESDVRSSIERLRSYGAVFSDNNTNNDIKNNNSLIMSPLWKPSMNGNLRKGDYAVVQVTEARGHTLRGKLCWKSDSIVSFEQMGLYTQVDDTTTTTSTTTASDGKNKYRINEATVRDLFTV